VKLLTAFVLLQSLWVTLALAAPARDITSLEAKKLINKNRNVFLLDVRTQEERRQGYIPGSVLIPINALEQRLAELPRKQPIVVYCAVGSRSRVVAQALAKQGYADVYNMRDGIVGWHRNGLPVTH